MIKTEPKLREDIVIILSDNQTADIAIVSEYAGEMVLAASPQNDYIFPAGDLSYYVGQKGKILTYKATADNVTDTKRLAALEKSIVLKQITNFTPELKDDKNKLSIREILIYGILIILLLAVVFK